MKLKTLWLCSLLAVSLTANEGENKLGTGLKIPTEEEWVEIEKMPKVRRVHPNKIGHERHKHQQRISGIEPTAAAPTNLPEIITDPNSPHLSVSLGESTLPSYVDNSTLPCFPYIGNQGTLGSCTAFGSTYYQATHEIGLLNGYYNKSSFTHILSPKWTYNMINGGADNGSSPHDAYQLLAANGAASYASFPYSTVDPYSWDFNAQDWVSALSNRTNPAVQVLGIGGTSQDLTQIKQLLANGHILTFGTYINSWQYTTIKTDPSIGADNRFVGQKAVTWMNGNNGSHFATIVGYNDNLWIDINSNGQVDRGEKGAFLIANSWGGGWGNGGFMWISYDAFLTTTAVINGPKYGRVALAAALNNIVFSVTGKAANYNPSMVAQFTITSGRRNQFSVSGGISSPLQMVPSSTFSSGAFNHQGGIMGFDGSQTTETITFALDLSDLVAASTPDFTRFYLITNDNLVGNPTTIGSFKLIDNTRNVTTNYPFVPLVVDNKTTTIFIDAETPPPPPPPPTSPTVAITSPTNQSQASGLLPISTTVTPGSSPIASVTLYVDNVSTAIDLQGPYTFLLDTTKLTNGMHTLAVKAVDSQQRSGKKSITIFVSN
ncbi:MAG: hypothetical protein JSS32_00320 [Verrucomicrobia bacterium]|nr:hypothetical protein [Verrucomicrobiota bacterium]